MANNNGSGGAMFVRQKKSQNAPDYGGDFELSGDILDYVLREAERGNPVKLEVSGWKKTGRGGGPFISIAVQIPYAVRQGGQPQQQRQGRGSFNQGDGYGRSREPIPTSRGQYQRQEEPRYPSRNQGQQRFREELNDDIPDFGGGRNDPPF